MGKTYFIWKIGTLCSYSFCRSDIDFYSYVLHHSSAARKASENKDFLLQTGMHNVFSFQRHQTLPLCDMQLTSPNYAEDIVWFLCRDSDPFFFFFFESYEVHTDGWWWWSKLGIWGWAPVDVFISSSVWGFVSMVCFNILIVILIPFDAVKSLISVFAVWFFPGSNSIVWSCVLSHGVLVILLCYVLV